MRSVTVIICLASVSKYYSKELLLNRNRIVQDLHHADLDKTTLGKPGHPPCTNLRPLSPCHSNPALGYQPQLGRHMGTSHLGMEAKPGRLMQAPFTAATASQPSAVENDGWNEAKARKALFKNTLRRLINREKKPGTLMLVRHGESLWNYNRTFTGWVDVDLSQRGMQEAEHASRLLLERGYTVDMTFTSRLKRAIRTTWIILGELNQIYRPVFKSWRLNERMYGALEGGSKTEAAAEYGEEQVQKWRRDLYERPPTQMPDHPFFHGKERAYADLDENEMPLTESLMDTMERTLPLWNSRILPALEDGKNVLIVAHANSLRGLIKHIDDLSADEINKVGIPNGIPLIYKFERHKSSGKKKVLRPVKQKGAQAPLTGTFIEEKGLFRQALQREEEIRGTQGLQPLKYLHSKNEEQPSWCPKLRALLQLENRRKLLEPFTDSSNMQRPLMLHGVSQYSNVAKKSTVSNVADVKRQSNLDLHPPCLKGRQLVIMRTGQTQHHKLGFFTGWEDVPISSEGREEAINAGKLMRKHGIKFDTVYTSWLSRTIETAWLALNELDMLWLPIRKTWRLNGRMFGALTGLSKTMVREQNGEEQLKEWLHSFEGRPPSSDMFSPSHPGNDDRYSQYVKDTRYSFKHTVLKSLLSGRIDLRRKVPKSESVKDCMDRTIPYVANNIMKDFLEKNKTILVVSSLTAIRGMLVHLLDIPKERISEIEIPTGLPIVYDHDTKSLRLLDDGTGDDMLAKYNFGSAADLLFKPHSGDDNVPSKGRSSVDSPSSISIPQHTWPTGHETTHSSNPNFLNGLIQGASRQNHAGTQGRQHGVLASPLDNTRHKIIQSMNSKLLNGVVARELNHTRHKQIQPRHPKLLNGMGQERVRSAVVVRSDGLKRESVSKGDE